MTTLRISLCGPLALADANGRPLRASLKGRGLLAVLALAPRHAMTRAAVTDKLWSCSTPHKASANLRRTLSDLKASLGPAWAGLEVTRSSVALCPERVEVSLAPPASGAGGAVALLSDLDAIDDPEFEQWLRAARQHHERPTPRPAAEPAAASKGAGAAGRPGDEVDTRLGRVATQALAPHACVLTWTAGDDDTLSLVAAALSAAVVSAARDASGVVVSEQHDPRAAVQVELRLQAAPSRLLVHAVIRSLPDAQVIWQTSQPLPPAADMPSLSPEFHVLASEAASVMLNTLTDRAAQSPAPDPSGLALEAMRRVSMLDAGHLEIADGLLDMAIDADNRPCYLAAKAFLRTFYWGERIPSDWDALKEEARDLIYRARRAEPHNAAILALGAHVHFFMLDEYSVGAELANESVRRQPANPLGLTFLSRAEAMNGQHALAHRICGEARRMGQTHPLRFMLEFNASLAALGLGRIPEALHLAECSHATEPRFMPTLRVLFALYLHCGRRDRARAVFRAARAREPGFSAPIMREADYPVAALRNAQLLPALDEEFR